MQPNHTPRHRKGPVPIPLAERFWSHVDKTGDCWLWTASTGSSGYGHMNVGGRGGHLASTHRIAWELTNGPVPDGLWVLHKCDINYAPGNPTYRRCVNPAHLFLGTAVDNNRDMSNKGRHFSRTKPECLARGERHAWRTHPEKMPRGERGGKAKLTESQVREIRRRSAASESTKAALSREFGVSDSLIHAIIRRRCWKHLP